jgi:hypothetical protein
VKDKLRKKVSAVVYNTETNKVTILKINGRWVSTRQLALQHSIPTSALNQLLCSALMQRLTAVNDPKASEHSSKKKKTAYLQAELLKLISKYSKLYEGEILSITKALVTEDLPDDDQLTVALSVLARKAGVPFMEFAQELAKVA